MVDAADVVVNGRAMQFRVSRRSAAPAGGGRKKKKMAVARLGGDGGGSGSGGQGIRWRKVFGVVRRVRVRWLAAMYRRALRRLRACYAKALRELIEGTALVSNLRTPDGVECAHAARFGPAVTAGF